MERHPGTGALLGLMVVLVGTVPGCLVGVVLTSLLSRLGLTAALPSIWLRRPARSGDGPGDGVAVHTAGSDPTGFHHRRTCRRAYRL